MPAQFKPETAALLLIDHQVGVMQMIKTLDIDDVKRLVLAVAKAAKALGMPIILTTSVETAFQQPIFKELADLLPEEYAARVKRKGIVNAWTDPSFRTAVEKTGRRQLVMGAVTTDICLVYPAISAVEAGYQVRALMDISGSPTQIGEDMARRQMEAAGVQLTATSTLIAELAQDWSTPQGQRLAEIMATSVNPKVKQLAPSEAAPI